MFLDLLRIILSMGIPCCLLAFGVFLTFRILDFADMTAEGSFLIGAAVTAVSINAGINPFLATFFGMLGGAACGFITGILNRLLKIPKLLSGIITMTATGSIALLLFGIQKENTAFAADINVENGTIFNLLPASVFKGWQIIIISAVVVAIVIAVCYFFFGTEYGMAIRATGMNENMSKAQGINTTITTITCVAISNALIGLAGSLTAQTDKYVSVQSATGYLVVGLASILLGETIFGNRSFKNSLISICLGTVLYFTIISMATFVFNMPTEMNKVLYAVLIILALCSPMIKKGIITLWFKIFPKKEIKKEEN
ncbi:MAG: ABC transporter permease [Bacilli bacterium]|nr:ABC transporter permease [Bacilli bacterium]